jgi:hypothetical protein
MVSKQDAFAKNLGGTPLGIPLYHPERFRISSGRVGDIAFFSPENGAYEWIGNAFDAAVVPL